MHEEERIKFLAKEIHNCKLLIDRAIKEIVIIQSEIDELKPFRRRKK